MFACRDDIRPGIQTVDFIDVDIVPGVELGFGLGLEAGHQQTQQE